MLQDHTGEFPVLVFADGTRMSIIKLGGAELPWNFEPLSTAGLIPETRPTRLLQKFNRSGLFEHTYIFQKMLTPSMKKDLQTGRWFSDLCDNRRQGCKFIGTLKQASELWSELNSEGIWIKTDFEKPATPQQCVKYYNNNKKITFIF